MNRKHRTAALPGRGWGPAWKPEPSVSGGHLHMAAFNVQPFKEETVPGTVEGYKGG